MWEGTAEQRNDLAAAIEQGYLQTNHLHLVTEYPGTFIKILETGPRVRLWCVYGACAMAAAAIAKFEGDAEAVRRGCDAIESPQSTLAYLARGRRRTNATRRTGQ